MSWQTPENLSADDIPELPASKITSGEFADERLRVPAVARESNGTWTPIYEMSGGLYCGSVHLFNDRGRGYAHFDISSSTIVYNSGFSTYSGTITHVVSGSVGATNVSLRVNSGWIEIYVGSSVPATEFALRFFGTVV